MLSAIALPAYREQIARARRSELQTAMLDDAGYMQRYLAANIGDRAAAPPELTSSTSPRTGAAAYRIAVAVPSDDPTSFVLTATRVGAMQGDRCGDFTYDNMGRRGLVAGTTYAAGASIDACWR